jgi:hypothetical protein
VQINRQSGMVTTSQGLQANALGAATECLSPSDMQRPLTDFTPEQLRQVVACANASLARQLNTQLPRQLDDTTRLDRLTTEGPTLTSHYTVLRSASSLPANAAQQLETRTRSAACAQAQVRQTIQMGGAYAYEWVDNQGTLIHRMTISSC